MKQSAEINADSDPSQYKPSFWQKVSNFFGRIFGRKKNIQQQATPAGNPTEAPPVASTESVSPNSKQEQNSDPLPVGEGNHVPESEVNKPPKAPEDAIKYVQKELTGLENEIKSIRALLDDPNSAKSYDEVKNPLIDLLNEEFEQSLKDTFKDTCKPPQVSWGGRGSAGMSSAFAEHMKQCGKRMEGEWEKAKKEKLQGLNIPEDALVNNKIDPAKYPLDPRNALRESLPALEEQVKIIKEGLEKKDPDSVLLAGQSAAVSVAHAKELSKYFGDSVGEYNKLNEEVQKFLKERKRNNAIIIATTVIGLAMFILTPVLGRLFQSLGTFISSLFAASSRTPGILSSMLQPMTSALGKIASPAVRQALMNAYSAISDIYRHTSTPIKAVNRMEEHPGTPATEILNKVNK